MPSRATTAAQQAAAERGVDLASVQGTGAGGRITKADVMAAAASSRAPSSSPSEVAVRPPAEQPVVGPTDGRLEWWQCDHCPVRYAKKNPFWQIQRRNHLRRAHGVT